MHYDDDDDDVMMNSGWLLASKEGTYVFQLKNACVFFRHNFRDKSPYNWEGSKKLVKFFYYCHIKYVVFPSNLNSFLPPHCVKWKSSNQKGEQFVIQLNSGFIFWLDLFLLTLESVWLLTIFPHLKI